MKINPTERDKEAMKYLYLNGPTSGAFFKRNRFPRLVRAGFITHVGDGIYSLTKKGTKEIEQWSGKWQEPQL